MKALTETQKRAIVKNVVEAAKDITKLNKVGYDFLYLANGFIAHYNLFGFIGYYEDGGLVDDILRNKRQNQWSNFHKGEENFEYYMSKKDVYNRICDAIEAELEYQGMNADQFDLFA